ncbi:MAG: hypothetical protein ACFE89_06120 [Candidatus Hodarchaeota archaeon]
MAPDPSVPPSSDDDVVNQFLQVLEDLKKEGQVVAIQICPKCKSPSLRSRETWYDIGGAMGISPPRYRCLQCGYLGRFVIEATNIDLDEEVLDDLVDRNLRQAQKLLKDLQHRVKERSK